MNNLTIIIPTINRHTFILLLASYYSYFKSEHIIIYIGDSSAKALEIDRINDVIKTSGGRNLISYFHMPNMNERQVFSNLAQKVKTKYICYSGDDDFFIEDGLNEILLNNDLNNEYIYFGRSILINIDSILRSKARSIKFGKYWDESDCEDDCSLKRLNEICQNYKVLQFALTPRSQYMKMLSTYENIENRWLGEYYSVLALACLCKWKYIEVPYLIRGVHRKRTFSNTKTSSLQLVLSRTWSTSSSEVFNSLSMLISSKGEYAESEVTNGIEKSLVKLLTKSLGNDIVRYRVGRNRYPLFIKIWLARKDIILEKSIIFFRKLRFHLSMVLGFQIQSSSSKQLYSLEKIKDANQLIRRVIKKI